MQELQQKIREITANCTQWSAKFLLLQESDKTPAPSNEEDSNEKKSGGGEQQVSREIVLSETAVETPDGKIEGTMHHEESSKKGSENEKTTASSGSRIRWSARPRCGSGR